MDSQTSLKTSQRAGCNPLNPPPGSASVLRKEDEPWKLHLLPNTCEMVNRWSRPINIFSFDSQSLAKLEKVSFFKL